MSRDNVLKVIREEHHYWRTCPCSECQAERERQSCQSSLPHVKRISVSVAYLLGFIPRRSPHGSRAKELAAKKP
jgi:hypothetical protein